MSTIDHSEQKIKNLPKQVLKPELMLLISGGVGRCRFNFTWFNDEAGEGLMSYKSASTVDVLALMVTFFCFRT